MFNKAAENDCSSSENYSPFYNHDFTEMINVIVRSDSVK